MVTQQVIVKQGPASIRPVRIIWIDALIMYCYFLVVSFQRIKESALRVFSSNLHIHVYAQVSSEFGSFLILFYLF